MDGDLAAAVENPGYVGIEACAECHAKRVAEFKTTRHFKACTLASGAAAPGFTPGRGVHRSHDPNFQYEMTRTGDDFIATAVQKTPGGDLSKTRRIGLAYGAGGKADEMYFAWQGDRLYNLPVAWMNQMDRWGNAIDSIDAREAPPSCLECHNTWVAHVPGTANQYRRDDMLLGVTCERCHGPAQDHVSHHRNYGKSPAHAILHPGTLARERQLEVCLQCHGNIKSRGPAFSYRPGEPLEASYRTLQTRYPEDEQVANQIRSLRQSKCFQKSEMTCTTCHSPHRLDNAVASQAACLKCHTPAACSEQPRLPEAVRADCVGCHMPSRTWMNVRLHTSEERYVPVTSRADHRIAIHPEAKKSLLLGWLRTQSDPSSRAQADRLAAELTTQWWNEADQRQRDHRLLGAIGALREAMKVDPSPATRERLQEAVARLTEFEELVTTGNAMGQARPEESMRVMKKILKLKPNYAPARGELGTMYLLLGDSIEASAQLRMAADNDPDDSYSRTMLATIAFRENRWEDAVAQFANADQVEPYDAAIHNGWGMALLKLERWDDAAVHFRRALKIDPRYAPGAAGLSESLRRQGQTQESLLQARRAVRWTDSNDPKMLLTLAEAYASAKRPEEARATLARALSVAEATNPDLSPTIRKRIDELQREKK